ncbi:MAG: DUF4339 domain-containing protein [Planctomycetales bacterium]|nr:DUF4339 domain-containing protein [Planctomycetales bacterium]
MGIRFSCHGCAKPLNIKSELAGRRGVCPDCRVKFRIPLADAEFSLPLEESAASQLSERRSQEQQAPENASRRAGQNSTGQSRSSQVGSNQVLSNQGMADSGYSGAGPATLELDRRASIATSGQEIDLLSGDPTATWYVRPPSGGQYGPATEDVLKSWIAEGRVAKNALLWRDGWAQWREASEALPEISDSLPGVAGIATDDPFSDGRTSGNLTTPLSREKTRPIQSNLAGDASIGAVRRKRTTRRITLVAILAALVVGLIVTLFLVAMTRK